MAHVKTAMGFVVVCFLTSSIDKFISESESLRVPALVLLGLIALGLIGIAVFWLLGQLDTFSQENARFHKARQILELIGPFRWLCVRLAARSIATARSAFTVDRFGLLLTSAMCMMLFFALLCGAYSTPDVPPTFLARLNSLPTILASKWHSLVMNFVLGSVLLGYVVSISKNYSVDSKNYTSIDRQLAVDGLPRILPVLPRNPKKYSDRIMLEILKRSKGRISILGFHMFAITGNIEAMKSFLDAHQENSLHILLIDPLDKRVKRRAWRICGNYSVAYLSRFWAILRNIAELKTLIANPDRVQLKFTSGFLRYRLVISDSLSTIQWYETDYHGHESDLYFLYPKGKATNPNLNLNLFPEVKQPEADCFHEFFKKKFKTLWHSSRDALDYFRPNHDSGLPELPLLCKLAGIIAAPKQKCEEPLDQFARRIYARLDEMARGHAEVVSKYTRGVM